MGGALREAQAAGRVDRCLTPRGARRARRHSPDQPGPTAARRALVEFVCAHRFLRRQCGLARRRRAADRHREQLCAAATARHRCSCDCRAGSRSARLGRNPACDGGRREPAAGAGGAAHGPGIPTEVIMRANLDLPTRRALLLGSGALFAWAYAPKLARAEGRDPRFLAIILRGALDGLAMVAPVGDPDWVKLRGDKALTLAGATPALPLDGFFALNPAMPNLHRLYQAGEAIFVHAAATPYRERSHFDGQDVLESGLPKPGATDTGWLNRALAGLEPGGRADLHGRQAFAVGPTTPLVVRGAAPVLSWAPPRLPPVSDDTTMRLLDLYRHTDPTFARVLEERVGLAAIAKAGGMNSEPGEERPAVQGGGIAQVRTYFADAASAAAKFLVEPEGPRVGALAFDGWDTHVDEGAVKGRLANLLGALDGALAAIETNMGEAWRQTVVVLVTEFGRTARLNGTDGTDHGTATVALLAGGALKGGRVIADWPGVKEAELYEQRDLKPTTDLRAVLKGLLADHLGADAQRLEAAVFPDSASAKPLKGLLA